MYSVCNNNLSISLISCITCQCKQYPKVIFLQNLTSYSFLDIFPSEPVFFFLYASIEHFPTQIRRYPTHGGVDSYPGDGLQPPPPPIAVCPHVTTASCLHLLPSNSPTSGLVTSRRRLRAGLCCGRSALFVGTSGRWRKASGMGWGGVEWDGMGCDGMG